MRCPGASGARTFTCAVGPEATAPAGRAKRRLCTSSVSLEASAATSTSRLSSVHWLWNSLRRSAHSPHASGHSSRTATPSKRGSGSTSQIESKRAPQDWESIAQVTDGAGQPASTQGHGPASTQGGAECANMSALAQLQATSLCRLPPATCACAWHAHDMCMCNRAYAMHSGWVPSAFSTSSSFLALRSPSARAIRYERPSIHDLHFRRRGCSLCVARPDRAQDFALVGRLRCDSPHALASTESRRRTPCLP